MAELALTSPPAKTSRLRRGMSPGVRDILIGAVALVMLCSLFISVELVETVFDLTRDHEDWELDEILASIPALALVMAWYAFRRWREVRHLNVRLADANKNLEITHTRQIAAETQLRDAQRLESLGRLAGGLAHELNNMLQPIVTLTQLSLKDEAVPDRTRVNLERVLDAARCCNDIVNKALTFAGEKRGQKASYVFSACLSEVVDLSRTCLPQGVALELEIPELPQSAWIDRTELTQIVTNLMTNAARAMEMSGTLTIDLGLTALAKEDAELHDLPAGDYFRMRVSDTGRGMTDDVQRRLFDPFFTTEEVGENVGLGLAVVHGIVSDWSGRITVHSNPGTGTRFEILIPVAED